MSDQDDRTDLGGGYFTNAAGDLVTLDKEGGEVCVAAGCHITTDAMSHQEGSVDWSLHCSHLDFDGREHKTSHPVANLHTSARQVLRTFLSHGLRLMPGMAKLFITFLLTHLPAQRFIRVHRGGWLENAWRFVQPGWVAGAGEPVHLELEKQCPTIGGMTSAGTLANWQENVAAPLLGNPLPMFGVIVAFLGPLLRPLEMEGGGVSMEGGSSLGKTTILQCGASVHGCGASPAADSGNSFVKSWHQTSNALEGIAAGHSDLLTVLDEVGLYAGGDLGSDLYLLAGGRGKGTMDSSRRLKDVATWRGNILSSGEMGMREAIERKGGRAKAGMLLRMIDVPVTNAFPNPPEGMTSGEFSNLIKSNCATWYGTAGRAFIEFLVEQLEDDPESVIACFRETLDSFTREMIPEGATPVQERAVRRFAAIRLAGHAAVEAEILPYTTEEVDTCVAEVMASWLTYRPTVTDVQRALVALQDFLVRTSGSLPGFRDIHSANPRGFKDASRGLIAFTDAQLSAACGGADLVAIAKELRRLGFLFCNETGRLKAKLKINGDTETRFYAVKRAFLEADLHRIDVDADVIVTTDTGDVTADSSDGDI